LTLSMAVEVPSNRRDFFGRRMYKTIDKTIASKNRKIEVKPLPEKGKPDDFSGAVGQFSLTTSASKEKLDAGESLDFKVSVSGNGNLKLFELPAPEVPSNFEAYDPEHSEDVHTRSSGTTGSISDTYTLVPHLKGEYVIAPLKFTYFDPKTGSYKTLRSKEISINVEHGPETNSALTGTGAAGTMSHKKRVATAGKHFRYIKLKTSLQAIEEEPFFKSNGFWILLFLPVVILPIVIIVGKKRRDKAGDIQGKRLRRANKLAKKYLSEAKKAQGHQKEFYDALERALHNYLKAQLDIQTAEMSKERIQEILRGKGVEENSNNAFIDLLKSCEFARYTPSSDVKMQEDYDQAVKTLSGLDKQL